MNGTRILVVEDESIIALHIQDVLRRFGYEITGNVRSSAEAIETAERTRPDVVLMDIALRGAVGGIETAEELRHGLHIPTIFLTATTDEATMERAKIAEPIGFVTKPFEDDTLHRIVQIALNRHRAEQRRFHHVRDAGHTAEELLGAFVSAVRDFGIFTLDPAGIITSWNIGAERINGYTMEEAVGTHVSRLYPAEDRARGVVDALLARASRDGEAMHEGWRVRKDGSRFWATVVLTAVYDPNGALRGFSSITRDITDRKRLQEDLRLRALQQASVARLGQSALAGQPIARLCEEAVHLARECLGVECAVILELVRDGAALAMRASDGCPSDFDSLEIPPIEEWETGFSLRRNEVVVIADFETENRCTRSPIAAAQQVRSAASVAIRTDGTMFGVLTVYARAVRAFSSDEAAFLHALANVLATAVRHQRYEEALSRSEHRFRLQYQRFPIPTFTWQKVGDEFVLVHVNSAAEAFAGAGVNRLIGLQASVLYPDMPEIVAMMERAFREQRHFTHQISYPMRLADDVREVEVTYTYVPPDLVFIYVLDITQQKRNEQAILETQAKLRSLSSRLLIAQEEERKRIAREVHDEL